MSKSLYGLRRVVEQAVELGQYVVHEKIGEGGMGTVYRASHAMLKRPTAIKLIAPERATEKAIARFEREVRRAGSLTRTTSRSTISVARAAASSTTRWSSSTEKIWAPGRARGAQPVSRTIAVLRQLAAALGEAHERDLVHRDVKPENVMLCTRGGVRDFVKVLDFGLVKDFSEAAPKITAEQSIAGTTLYMAPEAIVAPETVGPPADVYGVGCVACFLLTGRTPFEATNLVEICAAHVLERPEPPSRRVGPPPELDALVMRCLVKEPAHRPTLRAFEAELVEL